MAVPRRVPSAAGQAGAGRGTGPRPRGPAHLAAVAPEGGGVYETARVGDGSAGDERLPWQRWPRSARTYHLACF